jgi:hypothetical protein
LSRLGARNELDGSADQKRRHALLPRQNAGKVKERFAYTKDERDV